ncbi:MAG: restriction endonuclease [Anaerolineae bacterium]|nr:restriction endonuclease [Anaerolineae bacterium]
MAKTSDIPFGAQFSPNQIDLPALLDIIHQYAGNRDQLTDAILETFFEDHAADDYNRFKLADNVILSMRDYGLLDEQGAQPTVLAGELLHLSHQDESGMYERFAQHILLERKGHIVCETLNIMRQAGEDITLNSLSRRLDDRGLHVPRGTVHISSMRLWLAKAGIFDEKATRPPQIYEVNEERLRAITGIGTEDIDHLVDLSSDQRAFLRALAHIPDPDPLIGSHVAELAHNLYSIQFDFKSLPKKIYDPLEALGYIRQEKTTKGRGAKSFEIFRTARFYEQISEPILDLVIEKTGLVPKTLYEKPFAEIISDLSSDDTYVKGVALELLTIYLSRILDLKFKAWRKRSQETGGAEVDVIVEGSRLIFSRWQIQAKNTKTAVRLEDIAKEVGLALTFLYSNVVFIITTSRFTTDAHRYSDHVMRTSNLNIILFDKSDIRKIAENPLDIVHILNQKAENAMLVKARASYDNTPDDITS